MEKRQLPLALAVNAEVVSVCLLPEPYADNRDYVHDTSNDSERRDLRGEWQLKSSLAPKP